MMTKINKILKQLKKINYILTWRYLVYADVFICFSGFKFNFYMLGNKPDELGEMDRVFARRLGIA